MPYKNINPEIWGPSLWKFLHFLTLSYPENPSEEEQNRMFDFLTSLQEILPCEKCRNNFNEIDVSELSKSAVHFADLLIAELNR